MAGQSSDGPANNAHSAKQPCAVAAPQAEPVTNGRSVMAMHGRDEVVGFAQFDGDNHKM